MDTIGNFLTRIRNAGMAKHEKVDLIFNKYKLFQLAASSKIPIPKTDPFAPGILQVCSVLFPSMAPSMMTVTGIEGGP